VDPGEKSVTRSAVSFDGLRLKGSDMKEKIESHFKGNYKAFYEKYLTEVKKIGGDEFQSLCPFHEDSNPSLNFNDQKGTYFCHGCGKKGDIFHFYAKLNGLDTRRDFPKILKGIAADFGIAGEQKKSRIVKTYDYLNAEGKLHSQTVRMEPKSFWQRRPNGNGGWITKDVWKDVKPILYNLPDVGRAKEVIVVEGEKDVDTLAGMGFVATSSPMGAKKWRDEYNDALKRKDVVLLPDNDTEGRKHMAQVGAALNGIAKSLKWIDLPDLPSKGDVTNWFEKIGDKIEAGERLAVMIDNAGPYEPPKKKTLEDVILTTQDFSAIQLKEKREFLDPWLKENSINLISGWRGSGKTWKALSILEAVADEKTFGPWKCKSSVPCLFLDGEMPQEDIQERIKGLRLDKSMKNPLYIYSDAQANQYGLPRAHLAKESWRTKMKSLLIARHVKLWVIDNLASLASGLDENSRKDWDPINQWLLELRFAGIATIMLHHTNKDGGQRGTSAREDNLDISPTTLLSAL